MILYSKCYQQINLINFLTEFLKLLNNQYIKWGILIAPSKYLEN